ncbi:carboxypeptidase-like regulatory domain-containing protein [Filimonas effusa]|uniref:TonB C-terminal domain-containing protein n=1 Tax=Filimonas effusa TaxID=2508721 RepID=A0A4V1MAW0_9BACT|nr:carboxypeptidase-like regulatory domain-containing protein [Filimonas effusa]RXK87246.1 hypothetical protein ESB13_10825 [Filimonas effusa]
MAEQQHHNYFTHTDIDRYLSGRMSAAEMHELERAALQDPFLADAIEGYRHTQAALSQQHLAQITGMLQQPAAPSMVVPINRRTFAPWMKIAAAVLAFAATGVLGWYFVQSPQKTGALDKPLAKTDHPVKVEVPPAISADSIKSTGPKLSGDAAVQADLKPAEAGIAPASGTNAKTPVAASKPAAVQVMPEAKESAALPPHNIRQEDAVIAAAAPLKASRLQDTIAHPAEAPAPANLATELSGRVAGLSVKSAARSNDLDEVVVTGYGTTRKKSVNASLAKISQTYTLQGKVVSEQGIPLANVAVRPGNGAPTVVTDQQGYFRIQSKDSAATVHLSSIGFNSSKAKLLAGTITSIQLEPSSQSLAGVVVKEMSTAKKEALLKDSTYPAGGWELFQEYVAKKLNRAIDTTGGDHYDGNLEIELEIIVENNGNPSEIKVIRSFDSKINDQAIEAVKNGPRWIANGKRKKARVIVKF